MNTSSDRATRASWQQFSLYTILIMVFIGMFTNLSTIALIAFAGDSVHIPITVIIILVNLLVSAGAVDGISDWNAVRLDYDDEEKKTHLAERYAQTNTTFFKVLLCTIFGGTALSQLYVIYLI
ncbi:MAG: hypothetical protein ACJZ8I_01150 [Paracoccaceae bacterium]|tara:strand:- start:355 stop:723 length:369 start_codon:yes stop_codon:yes gene_type:complete